jgi:hypothetical protein
MFPSPTWRLLHRVISSTHTPPTSKPTITTIHRPHKVTRTTQQVAQLSFSSKNNKMSSPFPTPSSDPPQKEMQYFPNITTTLPAKSTEFRRVLWTGLYSQIVIMTVPVGGDIGEEVWPQNPVPISWIYLLVVATITFIVCLWQPAMKPESGCLQPPKP